MYLVSYPATGNPTVITRGWADPLNRNSLSHEDPMAAGEFYPMRFALQPTDHVFAVGERIRLVVMSSDNIYTIRPAPGTQLSVRVDRSEEHTSELQSLMRISYAVFCLKKKKKHNTDRYRTQI